MHYPDRDCEASLQSTASTSGSVAGDPGRIVDERAGRRIAVARRRVDRGQSAYLLDGDNIRQGLSDNLGFSPGDRAEHIRRVGPFVEVRVEAPVAECERRDPKGLYARARAGEIRGFTGVDAPYEAPSNAEVRVITAETTVEQAVDEIVRKLPLKST